MYYTIAIPNSIKKEKWIHSLELISKIEFKILFFVHFWTRGFFFPLHLPQ